MKNALIKWLGLNGLAETLTALRKENEELSRKVQLLTEQVDVMEIPDMDDYVASCDLDDNIESYLNNNDYATRDWVTDEINDTIDTDRIVEECVEKLEDEIADKVHGFVISEMQKTHPVLMTEETLRKEISEAVKVTLEKVVKSMSEA